MAVQTPKQRLANEKFNKNVEKQRKFGKKKQDKQKTELPISKSWVYFILFLLNFSLANLCLGVWTAIIN